MAILQSIRIVALKSVRRWAWVASAGAALFAQQALGVATSPHAGYVPFVSGLSSPIDIVAPPDGSGRLFVVQQGGAIRVIENGQVLATPFLSLTGATILGGGERGLLSLAFHPNYAANGYFYVYYTRAGDGALTIARYSRSTFDPRQANPASSLVLLNIPHSTYANHNGGKLLFGPDGYLYSTHGDGGSGDDPLNSGQTLSTLLGKLLRIDVDSGSPYAIPADNPFVGVVGVRGEIFAYGLRNTWRMSFDRLTGDLFLGDVGQGAREEISFLPATSNGGENFGWRVWEGARCNTSVATTSQCAALIQTPPILEYDHSPSGAGNGVCGGSVTGGIRYRGTAIPGLSGRYVFADYCTGRMWTAWQEAGGAWEKAILADTGLLVSTFGEDANGELYFAAGGTVYRLVADDADARALADSSGDSKADLVWRNAASGATALWVMNGLGKLSAAVLFSDPNWLVTNTGDFNGDGTADLLWRNATTGQTAIWLMNGTTMLSSAVIFTSADWVVTHAGDFNGDGRADLVWRNATTGQTALWLMNGTVVTSATVIFADAAWLVTHVADFNGDAKADLLWRNAGTGTNAVWLMNGAAVQSSASFAVDRNWSVTQTGDLDGDGRADLILRNIAIGQTAAWLMSGTVVTSSATLLTDFNATVVRAADLSGDGKADLIWHNRANGQTSVWMMNGTATTASAVIYTGSAWSVTQTGDLDADGRADLVWRNATTGQTAGWLMNGTSTVNSTILFGDGMWAVMGLNAAP
jgi:glucose/arabinose dehydrogenase